MSRIKGDLRERTFSFAKAIVDLSDALPQNTKGWVIGKQLIRAGTSIGANVREADHALTEAEFAQRCSIARKEASESEYWLSLCSACRLLGEPSVAPLIDEAIELLKILGTIVLRTQESIRQKDERRS